MESEAFLQVQSAWNVYESLTKALNRRACLRRLKPFFEEGFKNPKNFKKGIIEDTGGKQVP